MHTGKLRFLYSKQRNAKYTWRVHWSDLQGYQHFSITPEQVQYQDILNAINVEELRANPSFRAFNLSIVQLATDIKNAAISYLTDLRSDHTLQNKYETAMRQIEIQKIER